LTRFNSRLPLTLNPKTWAFIPFYCTLTRFPSLFPASPRFNKPYLALPKLLCFNFFFLPPIDFYYPVSPLFTMLYLAALLRFFSLYNPSLRPSFTQLSTPPPTFFAHLRPLFQFLPAYAKFIKLS